jgi:hypothetical protein
MEPKPSYTTDLGVSRAALRLARRVDGLPKGRIYGIIVVKDKSGTMRHTIIGDGKIEELGT